MDVRITTAAVKKPSVVRVKPIPRKNQSTPILSNKVASPIHVPALRGSVAQNSLVRKPQSLKQPAIQLERAHHIGGSRLASLLSLLLGESQNEGNLRGPIGRILTEIDNILREDVQQQLRIAQERSDRRQEDLTVKFEQSLRQRESAHLREITELHGRIDYLQDELEATREMNGKLEQQLEDANMQLLEWTQNMGSIMAELDDLRKEVEELRLFKAKYRRGMEHIERLRQESEKQKLIAETTFEEFAKMEQERDELRLEFHKNLQKLRQSNQKRHRAIMAEIDEAEEELLS
ncbi:hypothetical protein GCK32_003741 [Trichostrongylus colubriformis]|uniref:Uncharacterized protein n=1 Tax=Trichostrongylus colubriformis TaxID=6319 RepID=A0AAN8FGU7_TRICO